MDNRKKRQKVPIDNSFKVLLALQEDSNREITRINLNVKNSEASLFFHLPKYQSPRKNIYDDTLEYVGNDVSEYPEYVSDDSDKDIHKFLNGLLNEFQRRPSWEEEKRGSPGESEDSFLTADELTIEDVDTFLRDNRP